MKTKVLSLVVMFVLGTFTVFAGEKISNLGHQPVTQNFWETGMSYW